jgi:hypothetical protein
MRGKVPGLVNGLSATIVRRNFRGAKKTRRMKKTAKRREPRVDAKQKGRINQRARFGDVVLRPKRSAAVPGAVFG